MSNDSLPIYTSKLILSSRFYDYSNSFILPVVCAFGLFTSTFNILSSYDYKKDTSHSQSLKFIFINSLIDFAFLVTQFFVFTFRCGALCTFGFDYFPQLYHIQIFLFVGYSLVNSQVLLGIYVSIGRLRLFTARNSSSSQNSRLFIVYLVCLFVAICANLFANSLAYQVVEVGIYQPDNATRPQILFGAVYSPMFETLLMKRIQGVVYFITSPIMYLVYCGLNILVLTKFRQHLRKKRTLVYQSASNNSITFFF